MGGGGKRVSAGFPSAGAPRGAPRDTVTARYRSHPPTPLTMVPPSLGADPALEPPQEPPDNNPPASDEGARPAAAAHNPIATPRASLNAPLQPITTPLLTPSPGSAPRPV